MSIAGNSMQSTRQIMQSTRHIARSLHVKQITEEIKVRLAQANYESRDPLQSGSCEYDGPTPRGVPHGQGFLVRFSGFPLSEEITFQQVAAHLRQMINVDNADIINIALQGIPLRYEGVWVEGLKHGEGVLFLMNNLQIKLEYFLDTLINCYKPRINNNFDDNNYKQVKFEYSGSEEKEERQTENSGSEEEKERQTKNSGFSLRSEESQ